MNLSFLFAALFAAAIPAMPQPTDLRLSAPPPESSPQAVPVDLQCPAEHAAMGHCKPAPGAPVRAAPAGAAPAPASPSPAKPVCTSDHAAMGHCKLGPGPVQFAPNSQPGSSGGPKCPPEHAAMGHCQPDQPSPAQQPADPPESPSSAAASSGPEHAADSVWGTGEMARVRRALYAEHGGFRGSRVLIDQLELRPAPGHDVYAWDGDAWLGGDRDRLWLKSEGQGKLDETLERAEVQALFSRAIDPWFNLQAGIREDFGAGPDRTHLAIGIQGLAPYWFEFDAALFLSTKGEVTARLEAEYDQRVTNRLILQPRAEFDVAAQDVPERGIGAGLSSVEAGLRLRYEIVPEFAPYFGVAFERATGRTAGFARAMGKDTGGWSFAAGLRAWF
jgi:copper resistance protein B